MSVVPFAGWDSALAMASSRCLAVRGGRRFLVIGFGPVRGICSRGRVVDRFTLAASESSAPFLRVQMSILVWQFRRFIYSHRNRTARTALSSLSTRADDFHENTAGRDRLDRGGCREDDFVSCRR